VINISSYPILPNESEVMIVCDNVISYWISWLWFELKRKHNKIENFSF
jgi:hypothetical protein